MSVSPPKMQKAEAALWNCVAVLADGIPMQLAGNEIGLNFGGDSPDRPSVRLPFSVGGENVSISLEGSILTEQQLEEAGVVDFSALPGPVARLLVERAISEDLDRFERWSGHSIGTGDESVSKIYPIGIPFQLSSGVRGELSVGEGLLETLLELFSRLPKKAAESGELPVSLAVELGRTRLAVSDLENLTGGDVVLIEEGPPIRGGRFQIRPTPSLLFQVSLTDTQITIEEIMATNPDEEEPESEGTGLDVNSLPVELVFEIGRQQITVAELAELQPGATLALEAPLDDSLVSIRANGKLIGRGELVEVGDQVGVRLK